MENVISMTAGFLKVLKFQTMKTPNGWGEKWFVNFLHNMSF